METNTILVPVDFSKLDAEAIRLATSLARDSGGRLIILHVEEPPAIYGEGGLYIGLADPNSEALQKMLRQIEPADDAVTCEYRYVRGEPAAAIVATAVAEDADLIVMSTHGRTGLSRMLMGSVAETVVRKAPCPVLSVRPELKSLRNGSIEAAKSPG